MSEREAWFGLGNLQTLCLACHAAKTALEAETRAVPQPTLPRKAATRTQKASATRMPIPNASNALPSGCGADSG